MTKWYDQKGKNEDVVLSSRIRLARNFNEYLFADRISAEDAAKMTGEVVNRFQEDFVDEYNCIYMSNCSESRRNALREKRQIGSYLAAGKGAVLLSPDEGTSIMLNAEDHVRIQVLSSGMNLMSCFKKANEIDDYIDGRFDYAYDEKYGYKTIFPTNIGTGMRASYTLHLPALTEARRLTRISTELARFGIKFKTLYGDSEGGYGDLYQVSSQKSLGQEESEIIRDLDDIVNQLINQERDQRDYFYDADRIQMEDEIHKSYGVMKYARKLDMKDAMTLISEIMLGISLGILKFENMDQYRINRIVMDIQTSVIDNKSPKSLSVEEVDMARAQYIRENIPNVI